MAAAEFVRFLAACRDDAAVLAAYDVRNLAQVVFHAGNDGFSFTVSDAEGVIGLLEYLLATTKDGEPFDGASTLWRDMWGRRYLAYLVAAVLPRFSAAELDGATARLDGAAVAA